MLHWIEKVAKNSIPKFKKIYPHQINFLCDCLNHKRVSGSFCRQTGKTTLISLFAPYFALSNPKTTTLIIAPTDRQAAEMFNRMRILAEENASDYIKNCTMREITFINGSVIRALPTGDFGDTIRGQTAHKVILEESAKIKDEIVTQVIMPMLAATDGSLIQIGTFFGKNHFHRACYSPKYKSHIYDYTYALKEGLITQEFIDEQKEECTSLEFNQEYGCIAMEEADAYFSSELVLGCVEEIMPEGEPYAPQFLGVDFARMGQDSSTFFRARKDEEILRIVEIVETNKKRLTEAEGRIRIMDKEHNIQKIYLDESGLGGGPTDSLKEDNHLIEPVTFTVKSKLDIYSNLKMLMEKGRIKIPNNKKLIYQLLDFRYEITKSGNMLLHHPKRGKDDYCDALALVALANRVQRRLTRGKVVRK